jgi:hypothetical protein
VSSNRDTDAHGADRQQRLAAHVADCESCVASPPSIQRIAAALDAGADPPQPGLLSARALARLRPELEHLASMAWWRQVAACVLLASLPLPAVVVYDAYVLRALYDLLLAVLPSGVAFYVLASYAAILLLLFALSYAAIPILLARPAGHRAPVPT